MDIDARIADAAGSLMKNDAFKAACEKCEERYINEWRQSKPFQNDTREHSYQRLQALIDLLQTLRGFYEVGEAEKIAAEKRTKAATLDL